MPDHADCLKIQVTDGISVLPDELFQMNRLHIQGCRIVIGVDADFAIPESGVQKDTDCPGPVIQDAEGCDGALPELQNPHQVVFRCKGKSSGVGFGPEDFQVHCLVLLNDKKKKVFLFIVPQE